MTDFAKRGDAVIKFSLPLPEQDSNKQMSVKEMVRIYENVIQVEASRSRILTEKVPFKIMK